MKVRAGSRYVYQPAGCDLWDARTSLIPGDIVKVVNQRGCPPANTMGMCHVERDGVFMGLVNCASLMKARAEVLGA